MVFSSIPSYLGSSNWNNNQQQPNLETGGGPSGINPHLTPPPPPPPPAFLPPHVAAGSSIRPGSMADQARMANVPVPEPGLKCPRCASTNTKFCYFNNYSLSQPRHFCKTCRRYWTKGGSLRSVPVGGGCRRNKRSKGGGGSSSKSPAVSGGNLQTSGGGGASGSSRTTISSTTSGVSSLLGLAQQNSPLRFTAPLSASDLIHNNYGSGEIELNYYRGNISAPMVATSDLNYLSTGGVGGGGGGGGVEQWRLQTPRISSFAGLDMPGGLYPFQGGGLESPGFGGEGGGQVRPKVSGSDLKMEDNNNNQLQELNLSRFQGIQGNDQYWTSSTGTSWNDLSGFTSTATTSPLYK